MPKIKVIQIALAAAGDGLGGSDTQAEYLDDQGRVWYQGGKWVYPEGSTSEKDRTWQAEWHQLELPEDPTA